MVLISLQCDQCVLKWLELNYALHMGASKQWNQHECVCVCVR